MSVAVVDEPKSGLPGNISVWRARWLLMRYGGPVVVPEGVAVSSLGSLIDEVAERVGVARPDAVLLTGHGVIRAWASRRRRLLLIGLPLLHCLTVDEVRALIAHELAVVDHHRAHLVARLRELYEAVADPSFATLLPDTPPTKRAEAVLRATHRFATALERKADQAASSASGLHTAARAVVKADLAEFEFADLAFDLEEQVWRHTGASPQDLHAGWQAAVRAGAVLVELDDDTRLALMARHPNLAGAIAPLRVEHITLKAADLVPLQPLDPAAERDLARHVLKRDAEQWTTFAAVPADAWPGWIIRQARQITEQVALLLRREPTGPAEVVEVLLTRLAELVGTPADPDELDATPSVLVVAEAALTGDGWHRVHPAAVGVLLDPDGVEHNLHRLTPEAILALLSA